MRRAPLLFVLVTRELFRCEKGLAAANHSLWDPCLDQDALIAEFLPIHHALLVELTRHIPLNSTDSLREATDREWKVENGLKHA